MSDIIYIFLDVDGVLNSRYYFVTREDKPYTPRYDISPWNVSIFKMFTDLFPNHKIILSSSWRNGTFLYNSVDGILKENGLELYDKTPRCPYVENSTRGNEILQWMNEHGVKKERIVIFDDESDMGELKDRLIQTRFDDGLTFADIRKAELLLKKGQK